MGWRWRTGGSGLGGATKPAGDGWGWRTLPDVTGRLGVADGLFVWCNVRQKESKETISPSTRSTSWTPLGSKSRFAIKHGILDRGFSSYRELSWHRESYPVFSSWTDLCLAMTTCNLLRTHPNDKHTLVKVDREIYDGSDAWCSFLTPVCHLDRRIEPRTFH